jgi:hypothetical protein
MHSFDPATPVLMADGTVRRIDEIQIGDEVLATDPDTGDTEAKKVTALHRHTDTLLTDVTVSPEPAAVPAGGEGEGDRSTRGPPLTVIKTTAHHPFWDATTRQWVDAAELEPGSSTLVGPDGEVQYVVAVETYTGAAPMRDLTVATIHTYYVVAGDTPVLVHNTPGPGRADGCAPNGVASIEKGKEGVDLLEAELLADGHTVIGREVHVQIPGTVRGEAGSYRKFDVVTRKDGIIYFFESKNGPRARYESDQRRRDSMLNELGAIPYGDRALDLDDVYLHPGQFVIITIFRNN